MATGRTPDASETKRDEDSKVTGYDSRGKARTWLKKDLPGGKLPDGYADEPPDGTHPNDPDKEEKQRVRREREANEERAAAEQQQKGAGSGGKPK
jgi:hypothetical protein